MVRSTLAAVILAGQQLGGEACTAMAVDRSATVEGSGLVTHNNDCAECDPRVAYIAARDHAAGAKRPVQGFRHAYPRVVGTDRSPAYAAEEGQEDTVPSGFVDQVPHTYAYWESTYPLVNEHGLGFGESTCGGRLIGQGKPQGGEALFCVGELMRVGLERCKTARCAINTMGALARDHGFYGEDPGMPGAGETVTIVDNSETWVFHVTGGLSNSSATWVAQRVPENHVAVIANNFIIRGVNCSDKANFLCSDNVFSNARAEKLCDFETEADFDWLRCYAPDIRQYQYNPTSKPIPYYTTLRMWRIQSLASPEEVVGLTDDPYAFPFSVRAAKKISRADVMNWTRDYYKDTPYDMTQGVLAGPHNNPNREEGGTGSAVVEGQFTRGISIMRTNTAVVVEGKTGEKRGQSIAWLSVDQPLSGVFAPFFAESNDFAEAYSKGHLETFSRDSAFWAFNFVSNWMMLNWDNMMRLTVGPAQRREQQEIFATVADMEASWPEAAEVSKTQRRLQEGLVSRWWQLADEVVARYSDAIYTHANTTKTGLGYTAWWLQMIGYNQEFYQVQWVQPAMLPPRLLWDSLPWFTTASEFLAGTGSRPQGVAPAFVGAFVGAIIGAAAMKLSQSKPKQSLQQALLQ